MRVVGFHGILVHGVTQIRLMLNYVRNVTYINLYPGVLLAAGLVRTDVYLEIGLFLFLVLKISIFAG